MAAAVRGFEPAIISVGAAFAALSSDAVERDQYVSNFFLWDWIKKKFTSRKDSDPL